MPLSLEFQSTADLLRKLRGMSRGEEREAIEAELRRRDSERPRYAEFSERQEDGSERRERHAIPGFNYSIL